MGETTLPPLFKVNHSPLLSLSPSPLFLVMPSMRCLPFLIHFLAMPCILGPCRRIEASWPIAGSRPKPFVLPDRCLLAHRRIAP